MGLGLGLVGGVVGAVGNAVQAHEQMKQAANIRKNVRRGIQSGEQNTATSVAGIVGSKEYQTAANLIRGLYGIQGNTASDIEGQFRNEFSKYGGISTGRENNAGAINSIMAQAQSNQAGVGFLQNGPMDTLTADFQKGLQQAQSSRGLYTGQAGAAAEASGMAAFRANLQLGNLDKLMSLAEGPAALRAKYLNSNLNESVFESTGGVVAYGQPSQAALGPAGVLGPALSGFAQGFGGGASLGITGGGGATSFFGYGGGGGGGAGYNSLQGGAIPMSRSPGSLFG